MAGLCRDSRSLESGRCRRCDAPIDRQRELNAIEMVGSPLLRTTSETKTVICDLMLVPLFHFISFQGNKEIHDPSPSTMLHLHHLTVTERSLRVAIAHSRIVRLRASCACACSCVNTDGRKRKRKRFWSHFFSSISNMISNNDVASSRRREIWR